MSVRVVVPPQLEATLAVDLAGLHGALQALMARPLLPAGARVEAPPVPRLPADFASQVAIALRKMAYQIEANSHPRPWPSATVGDDLRAGLAKMATLEDDWDEEGAPAPLPAAVARGLVALELAEKRGLLVTDVDADVLGGVALYLMRSQDEDRSVWISIRNNGRDTASLSTAVEMVASVPFRADDADVWTTIENFLQRR